MRFKFVLPVVVLSLLLVAPHAGALTPGPAGASAKAKRSCKTPKVPVTVGKRTTCKPVAKAFPKPKALDVRLFYLQQALGFYPKKAAGGKKRKQAQKKLLRALPKVLAYIDRRKGAKASASGVGATASAACEAGVGGPSANLAGVRVSISGPNGGVLEADSGGLTVKIRYGICGSSSFGLPECPTADGAVDASNSSSGELVIEVWEGTSRLVERARTNFESKAKAKGKVGPDAKLKHVELEYVHEVFIVASGGIVRRGKSERKVRINMPGGGYDAAGAQTKITGDADVVEKDGFERVAKEAIDVYRRAEPRWSSFERKPHCAEPLFSPPSGGLKLRKGDSGQLGVSAKAKTGGAATEARWTLLGPENTEFSPGSSDQASPSFSYKVTNAPKDGLVKVTVKFTSTAGVGEGSWTQPTEESQVPSSYSGPVSGSAKYDADELGEGNSLTAQWNGGVTLQGGPTGAPAGFPGVPAGMYKLSTGSISYTFKGRVGDCDVAGNGFVDLTAQPGMTELPLLRIFEGTPRSYQLELPMPLTEVVEGVKSNCEEESENGKEFNWAIGAGIPFVAYAPQPGGPVGGDWGLAGSGSGNSGPGTPDQTWQWSLAPAP